MAQTGEQGAADSVVILATDDETARASVSEHVEQVARAAASLTFRAAELGTARRLPQVRHAAREVVGVAALCASLITAFGFGNWAAASALSTVLTDWQAALVLAAAWVTVGVLLTAWLLPAEKLVRNPRRVLAPASADNLEERQKALEQAEQTLRETIDRLGEAIAFAAEQRIAAAVLPLAGGMVEVGEEMVEATDEVIEAADEITDVIEERLPGGEVVNRVFDVVLVPGRFGVRIARSVLSVGRSE